MRSNINTTTKAYLYKTARSVTVTVTLKVGRVLIPTPIELPSGLWARWMANGEERKLGFVLDEWPASLFPIASALREMAMHGAGIPLPADSVAIVGVLDGVRGKPTMAESSCSPNTCRGTKWVRAA